MSGIITFPPSFSITEVKVNKEKASSKVGVSLKNASREAGVAITGLTPNSLLQGTSIRSKGGQVLLAVNGDPNLTDVTTAASLMVKSKQISLLVCEQHETYGTTSSCLQIVAAPFFKHNPSVCFSSTRGRTLVTISKIFKKGGFDGNPYLHEGDIVLAVNGIPVSKPEEAEQALHVPMGANDPVIVLHVVDIHYFRALILGSVDNKIQFKRDKNQPDKYIMMAPRSGGSTTALPVTHHPETQHMCDPSPYQKLMTPNESSNVFDFKNFKGFFKSWYQRVLAFFEKYNERIDQELDPIEDLACEYAWRHANYKHQMANVASASEETPQQYSSTPQKKNPLPQRPADVVVKANDVIMPPQPKSPMLSPKSKPPPEGDFISC